MKNLPFSFTREEALAYYGNSPANGVFKCDGCGRSVPEYEAGCFPVQFATGSTGFVGICCADKLGNFVDEGQAAKLRLDSVTQSGEDIKPPPLQI